MRHYTYRDGWACQDKQVDAEFVTFESDHVVFWETARPLGDPPHVVLAVQNTRVNDLKEVIEK